MMQHQHRQRRGTALVAALVCLVLVMAILGNMLVEALRIGRQMRIERDRQQCELLLQAGMDRAALCAASTEDCADEVWDIPAADIGGIGDGQVTIRVFQPTDGAPQIHVLAEYPIGTERSIRRSRTLEVRPPSPLPEE